MIIFETVYMRGEIHLQLILQCAILGPNSGPSPAYFPETESFKF